MHVQPSSILQGPSHQRSSSPCRALRLPNEILDIIFKHCEQPGLQCWHAISLVCRQWRDVVLPHLFNSKVISGHSDKLDDYLQFLAVTPWISTHVRTLNIANLKTDRETIGSCARALPCLRELELRRVNLRLTLDVHDPRQDHIALEKLKFSAFCVDPLTRDPFLELLALFTSIGELEVKDDETYIMRRMEPEDVHLFTDVISSTFPGDRLQCRKLNLGHGVYSSSFIPAFLCRIGSLQSLSSLSLMVGPSLGTLPLLNGLLCSVSSTLTALRITFDYDLGWFDTDDDHYPGKPTFSAQIQNGLSSCTLLETLELFSGITYRVSQSYSRNRQRLRIFFVGTWLSSIALLTHVRAARVQSAVVDLSSSYVSYDDWDLHSLPWAELRDAIHRLDGLRSLAFRLAGLGHTESERECVMYELRDFASVLTLGHIRTLDLERRHVGSTE